MSHRPGAAKPRFRYRLARGLPRDIVPSPPALPRSYFPLR